MKKLFTPGDKPSERKFETFLRASGLSRSQARGVIACGYKALAAAAGGEEEADNAEILRRLNDSLKSAVKDNLAAIERIKAGFDPAQPRDPAGQSTGGQWAGPGGARPLAGAAARALKPV